MGKTTSVADIVTADGRTASFRYEDQRRKVARRRRHRRRRLPTSLTIYSSYRRQTCVPSATHDASSVSLD